MKSIIGIILIAGAVILGYLGITNLQKSSKSVEILGIEITAEDNKGKEIAYVEIGVAIITLIGGIYLLGQKKR
ncbi:MAG: hypothetical protein PHT14_01265 [Petrimonas sp.]|jgi:hypothetical protein|uniref:DUF3185 domain-containing protein n=1 Tax=bioreactor metagenome TaxID=1076179 RepID=A0A645B498_9ZZZZ|nr:hypothetical protein [Petrimonas sp.]NLU30464.1 hypothetical protein [Bacteroidales bacterium]BBD44534.1 Hypothetical protein PEIBARAKI_4527 [Petrimonas sp. IBARAKI]HBC38684.1 hypothetical protein [Porphyromonadaceae bacterium]MDD3542478.1 hypothetical protein [Petrimonas sp.]